MSVECAGHGRSIASDNSDHSGARLSQNGDESLYVHDLKIWFRNYCVAYAFIVCVKITNEELFFIAFPLEQIHFFFWLGLDVVRSTGKLSSVN